MRLLRLAAPPLPVAVVAVLATAGAAVPAAQPVTAAAAGAAVPAAQPVTAVPARASAPAVNQMVVYRSGKAVTKRVSARGALVSVGRRRCAAPTGTALAALVRSRPGRLRLRDFGSCSRRASDSGGLFVSAIGRDRNRGRNGWVYKVGRRAASAGAADRAGAFGGGRLRSGQRVTWFYCVLADGGCQRTLELRARREASSLALSVHGYDDEGRGRAVAGATVHVGAASATSDASGVARLALPPAGRYRAFAEKRGLVRSFGERIVVR